MEEEANSRETRVGLTGSLVLLAAVQIAAGPGATDERSVTPTAQLPRTPWTVRVGPQRADLIRYNRVEGLSLGVRGQIRPRTPVGPLSITATARLGVADVHPNGRLDVGHENLDRRIVLSGYHELAAIEERARHFGLANSLMGLLAGRDDGDYYRRSGVTVEWTPPTSVRRSFRVRVLAEYQERVAKETDVQLPRLWDEDRTFRSNVEAESGWEYGASLELEPRLGADPRELQGGLQLFVKAVDGEREYALVRFGVDLAFPLPGRLRLTLEGAAGGGSGSPPAQALWYVGGPLTLRGYPPRVLVGELFTTGRLELDRPFSFGRLILFWDAGWAGDDYTELDRRDFLRSVGAGLALIDGIVRIDGAWQRDAPHDFRLDVYLDQIL